MKRLVIQNEWERLCLKEILEHHPILLKKVGAHLSAPAEQFRIKALERLKEISEG